VNIISLAEKDS